MNIIKNSPIPNVALELQILTGYPVHAIIASLEELERQLDCEPIHLEEYVNHIHIYKTVEDVKEDETVLFESDDCCLAGKVRMLTW